MISLIIVNYRSAALAIDAIRSARNVTSRPLEVLVVDNTESNGEADALAAHADRVIRPERNLGYGAAINLAALEARGPIVVLSNPDVVFEPQSLDLLAAEVEAGAGAAGPAFFWDAALTWQMPPAEVHTSFEKVDAALATRLAWWRRARDRRRTAARIRFWRESAVHDVATLSGAVIAMPLDLLQRERFDEQYFLYFEETDLLRRITKGGHRVVHVPAARCRHLFNQSAGASESASAAYSRSEVLYHQRWSSAPLRSLARAIAKAPPRPDVRVANHLVVPHDGMLVETSPRPDFETAAGRFVDRGTISIPDDIARSLQGMNLYMRLVDPRTMQPQAPILWTRSEPGETSAADLLH
jgi:N-acetylglucosaminyl-diphospho-decaprenol L-rhamnosyltransferase